MARSIKIAGPPGIADARVVFWNAVGTPFLHDVVEWPAADSGVYISNEELVAMTEGRYDCKLYEFSDPDELSLATYIQVFVPDTDPLALLVTDSVNEKGCILVDKQYKHTNDLSGDKYDIVTITEVS